ncbi:NfeD family protein [Azotosporobacter soli]|uniref:NfeD family protein n=1 Tax=Azotosporobacter soli TaxID=3055040 RepID=UPI0031FE9D9C
MDSFFQLTQMQQLWILLIVLCIGVELVLPHLVLIWCVPGALVSLILSSFGVSIWWQLAVFLAITLLLLWLVMPLVKSKTKKHKELETNADAFVGKQYVLTQEITVTQKGTVRIHGTDWSAATVPPSALAEGTWVVVREVVGNTLIVEAVSGEEPS